MLKPAFVDLSHHNVIPESLKPAKQSGVLGVIHKATEGTGYKDTKLKSRHHLSGEAGMLWGVYHFLRPGDMIGQAHHFLNTAKPYSDANTLFCMDWEVEGITVEDATVFLEEVDRHTKSPPVIYSGHTIKDALKGKPSAQLSRYRLWLAHYTSAHHPTLPPGWKKYWGWQYTDQGSVPGIQPPTDLNAFDGTKEELIDSWAPQAAPLVA